MQDKENWFSICTQAGAYDSPVIRSSSRSTTTRTTSSSWASVRCSSKVSSLLEFIGKFKKPSSLEGILPCTSKRSFKSIRNWKGAAPGALKRRRATPEAAADFEKTPRRFTSMSLVKILEDFKLTRSFKNVVNFYNTRRLPSASATTTTTSTTTTCCRSAASELPEALLRLFEP